MRQSILGLTCIFFFCRLALSISVQAAQAAHAVRLHRAGLVNACLITEDQEKELTLS